MDFLHFLNLQYWYCLFFSAFGGSCRFVDKAGNPVLPEVPTEVPGTLPTNGGIFEQFLDFFISVWSVVGDTISGVVSFLWGVYSAVAWSVSSFLFLTILTSLGLLLFIRLRELKTYGTLPAKTEEELVMRHRWDELLESALSSDPKQWKESVLAADRMLGDLLELLGVSGTTTSDRMKALPEEAFLTVPQAWEAHRVRNIISDGKSDFILTQREAFRTMKLYEQVFEEHQYI